MKPIVKVEQIDPKTHGLYVGDQLIGTSKLDCDARLLMHFLEKEFDRVYEQGYEDGQENVSLFNGT